MSGAVFWNKYTSIFRSPPVRTYREMKFNPNKEIGLFHPYRLGESILNMRGIRSDISFNIMAANRIAPDGTPHFAASHLVLFWLSLSHKKVARLKLRV